MGVYVWQPYKSSQMFEVKNPIFSKKKGIFLLVLGLLLLGIIIGGAIIQANTDKPALGDVSQCVEQISMEEGQPGPTYLQVVEGMEAVKAHFQENYLDSTLSTLTFDQELSNSAPKQLARACSGLEFSGEPFLISGSFLTSVEEDLPDTWVSDYQWVVGTAPNSSEIVVLTHGSNLVKN